MIIDSHCHLYYDSLANDIDNVIQRANDVGVSRLVCVGTNVEESKKCLSITENNDDIFSSSGVHPHDSKEVVDGYIDEIYELMEYESMIAIGEIGLDYFKNHSDPEIQKKVFKELMEVAQDLDKPVIEPISPISSPTPISAILVWLVSSVIKTENEPVIVI